MLEVGTIKDWSYKTGDKTSYRPEDTIIAILTYLDEQYEKES